MPCAPPDAAQHPVTVEQTVCTREQKKKKKKKESNNKKKAVCIYATLGDGCYESEHEIAPTMRNTYEVSIP
jgi:hypothetical protein